MPQVIGSRTTQTVITESRRVELVDDQIALFDPHVAPLITLLNRMKKREAVKGPIFKWLEDDYVARWAQNSGSAVANLTTSTSITVVDGTLFVPGDIFVVPKAVSSSTAPELCRVTARSGNTLTIVRDVGGAGVDTIPADGALRLLGSAYEEYASVPTAKTTSPTFIENFTQIERTVTSFSNTAMATETYGSPQGERDREHRKKMVEHKQKLNAALLWGRKSSGTGTLGNPLRTTDGLRARISTNILDAGGILTQKKLDEFARQSFRYGSDRKILLVAPIINGAISQWAVNHLQVRPLANEYGLNINELTTSYGKWAVVMDWMLENGVSGKNGFGGYAFSVDLDELGYCYLSNNNVHRDTKVSLDVVKDGADGKTDEILTEFGFKIKREKFHAMLYNVTDFMG